MRPLHIPLRPGLPDPGATGQWLGRDAYGSVYTLRWMPEKQCFGALGWRATHPRAWPELVLLQGEQQGFIVGHIEGPAIDAARRESFLAAALADLAADDAEPARRPWPGSIRSPQDPPPLPLAARGVIRPPSGPGSEAPAWSPWFWTVAMLFGLPALALALVTLAANTPRCDSKPAAGAASFVTCRSTE